MSDEEEKIRKKLTPLFDGMMQALYRQKGAQFSVDILASDEAQSFIDAHADALDSSFAQVEMSDAMRNRLQRSNWIFSGMKTFHEMNEAFPSLLDENGNRKPFEQFLNDVRKIDDTYNGNYLRAEYGFVQASAEMAAKWEEFAEDGDRYNLQYRTAGDDKVRPEHAALNGVTLPMSDPFWADYYPPNGWGCRCTVVQVRKSKFPTTDSDEAQALGEVALQSDKKGIFRFNSGQKEQTMPDYNPYTIRRCNDCDVARGKEKLARSFVDEGQLCQACRKVRQMCSEKENTDAKKKPKEDEGFTPDPTFKERLLVSNAADQSEIKDNTRAAKAMLSSFPDMEMRIRQHVYENGVKNPEYEVNGLIGDRKGIMSEDGISEGFRSAIKQGCQVVILDLDKHPERFKILRTIKISSALAFRTSDFLSEIIKECYIIFDNETVRIGAECFSKDKEDTKKNIRQALEKIKSDRSRS